MNTEYTPTEEELTEYVLGEADKSQMDAIEAAIEKQPATKALLEEIRETIELSESMFAATGSEALSDQQREVVESAANVVIRMPRQKTWQRVVGYAAAAVVITALGSSMLFPNVTGMLSRNDYASESASTLGKFGIPSEEAALLDADIPEAVRNEFNSRYPQINNSGSSTNNQRLAEIGQSTTRNRSGGRGGGPPGMGGPGGPAGMAGGAISGGLGGRPGDRTDNSGTLLEKAKELREEIAETEFIYEDVKVARDASLPIRTGRVAGTIQPLFSPYGPTAGADYFRQMNEPAEFDAIVDHLDAVSAKSKPKAVKRIKLEGMTQSPPQIETRTVGGKTEYYFDMNGDGVPEKMNVRATTPGNEAVFGHNLEIQGGTSPSATRTPPRAIVASRIPENLTDVQAELIQKSVSYRFSNVPAGNSPAAQPAQAPPLLGDLPQPLESLGAPSTTNRSVAEQLGRLREEDAQRFQVAGVPQGSQEHIYRPAPHPKPKPAPDLQRYTPGTEAYERIVENQFKKVSKAPLSTFSIDVDTASYSNMRRFLTQGQLPPTDSVRIEELINYFNYEYPQPNGEDPFSSSVEIGSSPWNPNHKLVRVGLKGKDIVSEERPNSNLVFLLDVSGSMSSANKLPLVKQSIRLLTQQLGENDKVAIVVYAGNSGLVLPSTRGDQHQVILDALNRLNAGGSTNGGAGIQLAYDTATRNFIEGGVNRVILATDGDFNVGTTNRTSLVEMIQQKAKTGVFLSVLGYGMGNLKDATMEKLANKGNGNYAYIDTFHEAKKVLADEMNATLFTIAKDVKIQVEFNPSSVHAYRLIGYENRALANRDFNDDTKDAGEIGAGHTVTALYEIVPTGLAASSLSGNVDALRYQKTEQLASAERPSIQPLSNELLTVKLRYKQPDGEVSKLLQFHVNDTDVDYNATSVDFKFATAVAAFGMKLRNSAFAQGMTYDTILAMAESGRGHDLNGYRSEFIDLVRRAQSMSPR